MQSVIKFYRGLDIAAVGLSTSICAIIPGIKELFAPSYKLLALIPLMLIIAKLLSWAGAEIFERMIFFRKLYFGTDYIEGVWFGDNGPKGFSINRISFNHTGISITGEQFNLEGMRVWTWNSIGSGTYLDSNLLYISNTYDTKGESPILGVSNMIMHKGKGKISTTYNGYWSSLNDKHKEWFQARKITNKKQLKLLNKEGNEAYIKWVLESQKNIGKNEKVQKIAEINNAK